MFSIRPATNLDKAFLVDIVYQALFVPPGREPFPRSALEAPEIAH